MLEDQAVQGLRAADGKMRAELAIEIAQQAAAFDDDAAVRLAPEANVGCER